MQVRRVCRDGGGRAAPYRGLAREHALATPRRRQLAAATLACSGRRRAVRRVVAIPVVVRVVVVATGRGVLRARLRQAPSPARRPIVDEPGHRVDHRRGVGPRARRRGEPGEGRLPAKEGRGAANVAHARRTVGEAAEPRRLGGRPVLALQPARSRLHRIVVEDSERYGRQRLRTVGNNRACGS